MEITMEQLLVENSTLHLPTLRELNNVELEQLVPAIVYLILLSLVGMVGNGLVCHVYRTRYRLSNSQCFIICLCCIDMFSCCVVIPFEVATITNQYMFEHTWLCKTSRFFNTLGTHAGSTLLISIAIDRYRKVCKPFGWQISSSVAKVLCVLSIGIGFLLAWPAIFIYGKKTFPIRQYNMTGTECSTDDSMKDTIFPFINTAVFIGIFIPAMIAVCIMYCLIGRAVRRQVKKMPNTYAIKKTSIPMLSSVTDENQKVGGEIDVNFIQQTEIVNAKNKQLAKKNKNNSKQISLTNNLESDLSWSERQEKEQHLHPGNESMESKETTLSDKSCNSSKSDLEDSSKNADNNLNADSQHGSKNDSAAETINNLEAGAKHTIEDSEENKTKATFKSRISSAIQRMTSITSNGTDRSSDIKAKTQYLKQARARRTAFLMFLITMAFVLSYTPHLLLMLIRQLDKSFVESMSDSGKVAYKFFLRSYFLNCAINPIIYGVCDSRFREGCKELFKRLWRRG